MPVVTIIGGPEGSGKSTLVARLLADGADLGLHFNPDAIAKTLRGTEDFVGRKAQEEVRFLRDKALEWGLDFSWETVMSHPSHIEFLATAREQGYEVRVIYIAIANPLGNVERVRQRVESGGRNVPVERIFSGYEGSLQNASAAIVISHRAMIFDNSLAQAPMQLIATYDGAKITPLEYELPDWFLPAYHDLRRIEA